MSAPYVDPIPEGWEMRLDDASQTYYFIDHKNQKTQWQHPINNLVYRPTEVHTRGGLNGNGSTPISVNRQSATKSPHVENCRSQFNPTLASEQKTTIPVSKPAGETGTELPEPSVSKKNDNDFDRISRVLEKAKPITDEVHAFNGVPGDKNYLRLMECLDVLILELDGIGVDGLDEVRTARRNAVKQLQMVLEMLEFRGSINSGDNTQNSDSTSAEQSTTGLSTKRDEVDHS
nr:BAG family molecular chaperone regulator 4 [Hymenolepis microstoma]